MSVLRRCARYLVIDNFPVAVAGPDALHPRLTRGFLEYSQHRGFVADPARVRHPKDKPKVEHSVSYVRERLFEGRDFHGLAHLRGEAQRWCLEVESQRIHGTTRWQPPCDRSAGGCGAGFSVVLPRRQRAGRYALFHKVQNSRFNVLPRSARPHPFTMIPLRGESPVTGDLRLPSVVTATPVSSI